MTKSISRGICGTALFGAIGLLGACGSNEKNEQVTPICVGAGDPACVIIVEDNSFVHATFPITDGVSTGLVRHAPDSFCMSGIVDSGVNGEGWGSFLVLGVGQGDPNTGMAVGPLDAAARGITQVRFTLEQPPLTGVLPQARQIQSADCTQIPDCLIAFDRSTAITTSGVVTVPLADYIRPDAGHPGATFDHTLVTSFDFYVAPLSGTAFNYDFCIRDLTFLDAAGRKITP